MITIPRGTTGNRAVNLNEHIVPETLMNRGVNENADVREWKLYFHDAGHDHTGGRQGALIGFEWNLLNNGSFEHNIACVSGLIDPSGAYDHNTYQGYSEYIGASGIPDFWAVSGDILTYWTTDSYTGDHAQILITNPLIDLPSGDLCFYQDIPSPSGYDEHNLPSDLDFTDQSVTIGMYTKGEGSYYLGIKDNLGDHWTEAIELTDEWLWNKETFTVAEPSGGLKVMICPSGTVYIDQVQMVVGTRLPSKIIYESDTDIDAWRKHNTIFTNYELDNTINAGDVVAVSSTSRAAVTHPNYFGQGGVMGVAIAPSTYKNWIAVCNLGIAKVNVTRPVAYGDLLCAGNDLSYPGYSISEAQIHSSDITIGDLYTYATALEEKTTEGPGQILAFIHPKASRSNNTVSAGIHLAPEYDYSIEHGMQGDNQIPMERGNDTLHNYYKWNLTEAQARNRFTIVDNIPVSVSGEYSFDGVLPTAMNIDIDRLYSNEVYQEGQFIGELGKIWGMQPDRVNGRMANSSIYHNVDVSQITQPEEGGSGFLDDWTPIGFDLYDGNIQGTGTITVDGIDLHVDINNATGTIEGWFVANSTGSYINSIVTRLPVPRNYIEWMGTGLHFWNKADDDASVEIMVIDCSGNLVLDTGEIQNHAWTESDAHISGEFEPNEWFTVQTIFKSTGDNSSFMGEMSLYYHSYSL